MLLPFNLDGNPNLDDLFENVSRTIEAGLTPAINMDTGYVNLLAANERLQILNLVRKFGKPFVAGAYIQGSSGDPIASFDYTLAEIQDHGGTPVVFPCDWLKGLSDIETIRAFEHFGEVASEFIGFELGEMFVHYGRVYSLDVFRELIQVPQMIGLKHSSLRRDLEWDRLTVRDQIRPEFQIYTGNDLAIDMVMWGSDYLLGLSAFYPEAFAQRDRWWAEADNRFYELNDALQYLGAFAFRAPVPAYKHSCAQFLKLRGRISSDSPHPNGLRRPESDLPILSGALRRIDTALAR